MSEFWPVIVDGSLQESRRIAVDILAGGLNAGAGLFETLAVRAGTAQLLGEHLRRLHSGAEELGFRNIPRPECWEGDVKSFEEAGLPPDYALRFFLFPGPAAPQRVAVSAPLPPRGPAARLGVADPRCQGPRDLAHLKATSYLKSRYALSLGVSLGWDEVLFLAGDEVLEGTRSSVFIVAEDRLSTPPLDGRILPGVTRSAVLGIAHSRGIPFVERGFTLQELMAADEIFLCSSLMGVWPVSRVLERETTAPGPLTRSIQRVFETR